MRVLRRTYGRRDVVYSGPLYRSMAVAGNAVRMRFDHAESGLSTRDGAARTWSRIAGPDSSFVDAVAEIQGSEVVVSSPKVPNPVAVRFAWHEEAQPNLTNKEGLPASAFRTDRW